MTGRRSGSTSRSSPERRRSRAPRAKKRFGQHFLSDAHLLSRIVDAASIGHDATVLEVGPGLGALTEAIAARGARVVAVEIDGDLVEVLRSRFATTANVCILQGDVLERPPLALLAACGAGPPYAVVANLPYNVAAPVLRHFLEAEAPPQRLVVMVQLEVAESIVSAPPHMSLLGVATQVYADATMIMKLAPGAFSPPPKVQSAVVRLDVLPRPRVGVPLDGFFRVVRAGFGNPRKQLRNSMSFGLHLKQADVDELMRDAAVDATLRPQVLRMEDWAAITRAWLSRTAR